MIRSVVLTLSLVFSVSAFGNVATTAQQNKADYYTLENPIITELADDHSAVPMAGLSPDCNKNLSYVIRYSDEEQSAQIATVGQVIVVLDQIINIGKIVIPIIKAGVPVVNIKTDTANALPAGISCWSDLGGWKAPNVSNYRVVIKNKLGIEVIDFTYKVMFTAGGSADGIGRYITNATILPASVNVAFGFDFNVEVSVPSVFNMGTKSNPIAAMQIDLKYKAGGKIPVNYVQRTYSYLLTGKNQIKDLN